MAERRRCGDTGGPWWSTVMEMDSTDAVEWCCCSSISESADNLAALSSQLRTAEAEPGGTAVGQDGSNGGRVEGGEVCLVGRPVFLSLWREGSLCWTFFFFCWGASGWSEVIVTVCPQNTSHCWPSSQQSRQGVAVHYPVCQQLLTTSLVLSTLGKDSAVTLLHFIQTHVCPRWGRPPSQSAAEAVIENVLINGSLIDPLSSPCGDTPHYALSLPSIRPTRTMLSCSGVQPLQGLYTHLCSLISTLRSVLPHFLSWDIT